MRALPSRSFVRLLPALALVTTTVACQSSTEPAPTGVAAIAAANRDKSTLIVTSTGTPTASQTFPGSYAVNLILNSVSLYRAANGTFGGDVSLTGTVQASGQAPASGTPKFTLSCLVFEQRGNAVHVYAQGMAVDGPGFPPGVSGPSYVYLVDDPAGDQMWSGPMGKLGPCEVPSTITQFDGTVAPVSLRPMLNGSITVTVK